MPARTSEGTPEARAFRAELLAAGLLVDLQVAGLYARSSAFESVVDALDHLVGRLAATDSRRSLRFPPVFARAAFERTDYLKSFPDLAGAVMTFVGDDAAHRRLLTAVDQADDWIRELQPAQVVLCSSACHPLYAGYSGQLTEPTTVDLLGWCFRHEPSLDPGRMQVFRQREVVYLGYPDEAVVHRDVWVERALELTSALGLEVRQEVANDPFFGRAGRMLAHGQREAQLKIEILAPVGGVRPTTAIASSNCHIDHFGRAFGIELPNGEVAHSACVGFGLERMTLALLTRHGLDLRSWPTDVRSLLWP